MIQSPIRKVLSSIRKNQVQALLMGGQACVLYGAAEFSRDTDLAILAEADNLERLQAALNELAAETIAVPPFEKRFLDLGLAVHFRCQAPGCAGMRIDVLSKMRGVAPFGELWQRRTTIESQDESLEVLSLPDLVQAKKTQRDKDWPMIARLVEASLFQHRRQATPTLIEFWLLELRTAELLVEIASDHASAAVALAKRRPLLAVALRGSTASDELRVDLQKEQALEQAADRQYWVPLKQELERLRREARKR